MKIINKDNNRILIGIENEEDIRILSHLCFRIQSMFDNIEGYQEWLSKYDRIYAQGDSFKIMKRYFITEERRRKLNRLRK